MAVTRLVLVRHGESAAQAGGYLAGHDGCRGLSDLGRRQADALARRLERGELGTVSALYASHMERAVETARIIGPSIGHDDPVRDCDVCELHPGDADGLTMAEVAARWPAPADSDEHPWTHIDNSESWFDMRHRVTGALARLADAHQGETVVVACHGGVVAHAVHDLLGNPPDADVGWLVATNTSLTELVLDDEIDDWRAGRWGLIRFNDAAHLLDLA